MKNILFPSFLQGRAALGLLILRLVFGSAFILHGSGKIVQAFNWMGDAAPIPGFLQALAALSEFGGGIAMILGLLSPLAALGLLATMSFAVFMVHVPAGHAFVSMGDHSKPTYELALVYWSISLLFLLVGPGAYSIDALLFNRKKAVQNSGHPAAV